MSRTLENPFGGPDGSRVDIDELLENFVSFSEREFFGGIATKSDDRTARIIIGRKGSGKTSYLRRLQAAAKAEESLYVDRIARDGLSTEDVLTFSQLFTVNLLEENWTKLWYCAIICSVTSHLMFSPRLRDKMPDDLRAELQSTFKPILLPTSVPLTPYQAASQIINNNAAKNRIERYFHSNLWSQLEWHLCEHLAGLPPLCFFLDAVDEEFAYAPMYWLQAQKGLFLRTIKFLRHQHFGGRLHIFICIREIVLSSVLQGDNAARYLGEPSIRVLKWNMSAIEVFLKEKLAMLDDIHFIAGDPVQGKTCASWLGRDTITDPFSRSTEPVLSYLLRHTRLLPRDTIILGNNLATKVHEARDQGCQSLTEESIRKVVADTSHYFAHEQIFICGKQLAADLMPERATQHGYSSFFVGSAAYAGDISDKFRDLLACLRYHVISYADLQAAQELAFDSFGDAQIDPLSILWQNGLLGYVDNDFEMPVHIYYSEDRMLDFRLPAGKEWYVLHPCLLKALGLRYHPHH